MGEPETSSLNLLQLPKQAVTHSQLFSLMGANNGRRFHFHNILFSWTRKQRKKEELKAERMRNPPFIELNIY